MVVVYGVLLIIKNLNQLLKIDKYSTLIGVIGFIAMIAYGFSVAPISYIYVIAILPERGFAIVMIFHWIGIFFINFPFSACLIGDLSIDYETLSIIYTIIYLLFAVAVLLALL